MDKKLMRVAHRKVHRYVWSLLLPLLFLVVLLLSDSSLDTMPGNAIVPGLSEAGVESSDITDGLAHRTLP
ncbi:MAG: hypothetical protein KTR32_29945 [Granulosicoccus sp.]|nr:hypothetical protein [Granulosicoccus sp.]